MHKNIHTLVKDMQEVIEGSGGWDEAVSKFAADAIKRSLDRRLSDEREERKPALSFSGMGTPCKRKLWYNVNQSDKGEPLPTSTKFKFLYGDILEDIIISLAMAAGHDVRGLQSTLEINGVKGHRDCVIDGITVDVKSASSYSYKKFASGGLRDDDPFGYISQLSSYVYAARDEDGTHPSLGAFLVVDKQNGHICLDMYDFGPELDKKEEEVEAARDIVNSDSPPPRTFDPVPEGKSGNMKLGLQCSYCGYKKECYPHLRTFLYSRGPVFLTTVKKVPNVQEVKT